MGISWGEGEQSIHVSSGFNNKYLPFSNISPSVNPVRDWSPGWVIAGPVKSLKEVMLSLLRALALVLLGVYRSFVIFQIRPIIRTPTVTI